MAAGPPKPVAEAVTDALRDNREAGMAQLATKADLEALRLATKADLLLFEQRLIFRLELMLGSAVIIVGGLAVLF